jgi:hypothetical protein
MAQAEAFGGYGIMQPARCAGGSQGGETPKNRKSEGENDLTWFKHAFQHNAGKNA